jgi:uncharacterized protein YdeI (YjbR/CyaY-like superfamily)
MNPKVDTYFSKLKQWQEELEQLRAIILDCGLTEELKWGSPCYTFQETNVILLGGFKDNCVISFLKGVLLADTDKLLEKPGENSQSARVIRFTSEREIVKLKKVLKAYIYEALEVEKAGLKVDLEKSKNFDLPDELLSKFKTQPKLKTAFTALTTGRQRAYVMFFSDSKNSKTREARIEKYTKRILDGKGINDCVCGLSKRMPSCDGSHKFLKSDKE